MCSKDLIEDRPTLFQLTCVPLPYKYLYSTTVSIQQQATMCSKITATKISISEFMVIFFY